MGIIRSRGDTPPSNRALLHARAVLATTRRAWLGRIDAGTLALAAPMFGRSATRAESDTYDEGELVMKTGANRKVYWAGPSVGFDLGANASKVFVLVYDLPDASAIFKRYPGVDGSLHYVGVSAPRHDRQRRPLRHGLSDWAVPAVAHVDHLSRARAR